MEFNSRICRVCGESFNNNFDLTAHELDCLQKSQNEKTIASNGNNSSITTKSTVTETVESGNDNENETRTKTMKTVTKTAIDKQGATTQMLTDNDVNFRSDEELDYDTLVSKLSLGPGKGNGNEKSTKTKRTVTETVEPDQDNNDNEIRKTTTTVTETVKPGQDNDSDNEIRKTTTTVTETVDPGQDNNGNATRTKTKTTVTETVDPGQDNNSNATRTKTKTTVTETVDPGQDNNDNETRTKTKTTVTETVEPDQDNKGNETREKIKTTVTETVKTDNNNDNHNETSAKTTTTVTETVKEEESDFSSILSDTANSLQSDKKDNAKTVDHESKRVESTATREGHELKTNVDAKQSGKSMPKNFQICYICGRQYGSESIEIHEPQCLEKWRIENDKLPPERRQPEPVKFDALKQVLDEEGETRATTPEAHPADDAAYQLHQASLVPCKFCTRTFAPDRIQTHMECCPERPKGREYATPPDGEIPR